MIPPSNLAIRSAVPSDAAGLGRLGAALVEAHHVLDARRFLEALPDTASGYGRFLQAQLDRPQTFVLVAEADGVIAGYTYAALEDTDYMALRGPAGVVHDLVVDPERRGEGIGRRLLDVVIAALLKSGAPRIVLSTAARNVPARRLFESIGFRPTMLEMTWDPEPAAETPNEVMI